jgi:hypothetical protein
MNILDVSQEAETDAWLAARRGLVTGTKSGELALEHYSVIDPETIVQRKMNMIAKAEEQHDLATQMRKKHDDIDKKMELSASWAEKAKTAKTEATAKKNLDKSKEYVAQAEELKAKHLEKAKEIDAKANELLDKAQELDKQISDARLASMKLKVTSGYYGYLAESLAEEATGENPAERGHRLENENAMITVHKLGIPESTANFDPGIWVSDDFPRLAVSPDVHEVNLEPTWAIECKSLGSANHFAAVVPILTYRRIKAIRDFQDTGATVADTVQTECNELIQLAACTMPEYVYNGQGREFDFVPDKYKAQALQYFVVNDALQTLYFSFYDDRVYSDDLRHVFLTITRDSIATDIEHHKAAQLDSLMFIDTIQNYLVGVNY